MRFRKFRKGDIRRIAKIKNSVFSEFNKLDYFDKTAIKRYLEQTSLDKSDKELLDSFRNTNKSIFYVATENNQIVGYIKGSKDKIGNLFVSGKSHRKGIGKKLVELLEKDAKKQGSNEIKISASTYAVPFYQRMGYKKTTGIRNIYGLKIQPMKKILK